MAGSEMGRTARAGEKRRRARAGPNGDRKAPRRPLGENGEHLRAVMHSSPIAIAVLDREGNVVGWNPAAERMFGWSEEEVLGRPLPTVPEERAAEHRRILEAVLRGATFQGDQVQRRRKDGQILDISLSTAALRDADGSVSGVVGMMIDITDQMRTERELRASEARFRSTLNSLKEGFQVIGFDWRYLFVNDTVAVHGRRAKEDLLGRTMMECYPGIEDSEAFAEIHRCMETRRPHRMENELVYPDGATAWFELDIQPVEDGVCVLSLDITDRRRAQAELMEREERLSTVLASIGDAVIATDREGRIEFLNPAAEALTGWRKEEAVGRPFAEVVQLLHEETGLPIDDPVAAVIAAGGGVRMDCPCLLVSRSGERTPVEDSGAPIRDSAGTISGAVLAFHDIGLQRHAAEELRRLTTRLLGVQEEERRQVAYDIHDGLGQLITAASMHLETFVASRRPTDEAAQEEQLARTRRYLQDAVVEMRRTVSHLGPLLLEDLGLGEASRKLMLDLGERAGWQTEFESQIEELKLHSTAETALYRIVQEALSNAVKHAEADRVRLSFREHDGQLLIEVRDWGRGFDATAARHPAESGHSVGLLGMRERAALIGGRVSIKSEPGQGTTVTVGVPLTPGRPPAADKEDEEEKMEESAKPSKAPREEIAILIADDHPMVREGLRSMLDEGGLRIVGEAVNGAEAVDLVRQTRPDVVLMDVRMPDMDGLAATEIIKQESPETSVIVITSYESKDYLRRAIDAGAAGYLLKGMARDALIDGIRLVRGGGSLIDARLLSELLSEMGVEGTRFQGAEGTLEALTPREQEVLHLLVRGLTNKEIAAEMHYSVGTVKNVVQRVIEKLGVSDRTQAAVFAVRAGMSAAV